VYFEWLLDAFTTKEDLFGSFKYSKMSQDINEHETADKMPEAHIVFLEEVFKAFGGILNSLLKQLDESRRFYNGRRRYTTPLISCMGASNELPSPEENLDALYDRFLLRYYVGDIVESANFRKMLDVKKVTVTQTLTLAELQQIHDEVDAIECAVAKDLMTSLREKLAESGLTFSPRRWREAVKVVQAHAWYEGRSVATVEDLEMLENVLWEKPEDKKLSTGIILTMVSPDLKRVKELLDMAKEVYDEAMKQRNTGAGAEAGDKFKKLRAELATLTPSKKRDEASERIRQMHEEVIGACFGVAAMTV